MGKRGRKTGLLACVLVLTIALTACSGAGGNKEKEVGKLDKADSGTLKVAYFNEQAFYMQYGNAFQAMFPKVTLEVISTESAMNTDDPVAAMEQLVADKQPDVLFLTEEQYAKLAQKGKLYDLDAVVKQDQFDLAGFQPSVIDLLKARGGGKLYGLSPSFSSMALYYNKELFDQYGIPYPKDGMSWDEVLKLAERFPVKKDGDDAWFGLYQSSNTSDLFELIRTIGEAKGLLYADADAGTVSIDSPDWKPIFQSVIDGYKSGSISMPSQNGGPGGGQGGNLVIRGMGGKTMVRMGPNSMKFMTGQAAMTIDSPMIMNLLNMDQIMGGGPAKTDGGSGGAMKSPFRKFEWDVVTVPVDPSQPDVAGGMSLDGVFSISASSENVPAAWELLKYANGEQLAKTSSMSSPSLSSRTAYKKQMEGKNMDAFYSLGVNSEALLQSLPEGFTASFAQLASNHIQQVVGGTESLDDALRAIQSQGQDLLTKAAVESGQQ